MTPASTLRLKLGRLVPHIVLWFWVFIALFPIVLILINFLKERRAIFKAPYFLQRQRPSAWRAMPPSLSAPTFRCTLPIASS